MNVCQEIVALGNSATVSVAASFRSQRQGADLCLNLHQKLFAVLLPWVA